MLRHWPGQSPVQCPASSRLLPPAWQGWEPAGWPWGQQPLGFGAWSPQGFSVQKGTFAVTVSQQSQVPGCFVLTCRGAAGAASRGCLSHYEHPSRQLHLRWMQPKRSRDRLLIQLLLALPTRKGYRLPTPLSISHNHPSPRLHQSPHLLSVTYAPISFHHVFILNFGKS